MKQGISIFFLLLTVHFLCAQGEDSNLALEPNPEFCKPGVSNKSPGKGLLIEYTYNPEFTYRPTNAEQGSEVDANQRFLSKLKIPVLYKNRVKFLLGLKYGFERYNFDDIDPENASLFRRLNESKLKDTEIASYFILPLNHKHYLSLRASTSFRGDYEGPISTSSKYMTYRVAGIFGIKKHKDLEYGFGVYYSRNVRQNIIFPFGLLNWTFNDRWGLEAGIPVAMRLRHNLKDGNLLMFAADYSSQSYTVDVRNDFATLNKPDDTFYHYRRGSIELSTSYMRHFGGWTWMQFKLGYALNINSDAQNLATGQEYDLRPTGSIVGTVSFFLSPPKKHTRK